MTHSTNRREKRAVEAEPEQEGCGQTYVQPRLSRTTLETETPSEGSLVLAVSGKASILTGSP